MIFQNKTIADDPLYCTALHRTAPHRTAPHRTAPHRTAPHRTAPHRTAPHRTAPQSSAAQSCAAQRSVAQPQCSVFFVVFSSYCFFRSVLCGVFAVILHCFLHCLFALFFALHCIIMCSILLCNCYSIVILLTCLLVSYNVRSKTFQAVIRNLVLLIYHSH